MAIQITVSCLDGKPFSIVVDQDEVKLGRSSRMDVRLPFTTISGHHISLHRSGAEWTVEDAGSTNGTLLNGSSLAKHTPMPIVRNAVLEVINVRIELEIVHIVEGFTLADSGTLARRMASDQLAELESDRARFTLETGNQKNQSIFISDVAETFAIGGSRNDGIDWGSYRVPDFLFSVSRHGEGFAIDRAATQLRLNGAEVQCPHTLQSNDEVRFEDVVLRFDDPLESYFVALDKGRVPGVEHELLSPVGGTPSVDAVVEEKSVVLIADKKTPIRAGFALELVLLIFSFVLIVAGIVAILIVLGILNL